MAITPPEITPGQLIAREFVGGKLTRRGETLPEALKLASEMTHATENNWQALLKKGAELHPDKTDKIKNKVEQIGTARDTSGARARSLEEQKRFESAKKSAELTNKFVKEGYDGLDETTERKPLRDKVLAQLNTRDEFKDALKSLTPKQQQETAERILRNPELRRLSSEELESVLNDGRFQFTDTIDTTRDALAVAEDKKTQLTADIASTQKQLEKVTSNLDQLDPDQIDVTGKPAAEEFKTLEAGEEQRLMDIQTKQRTLTQTQKRVEDLASQFSQTAGRKQASDHPLLLSLETQLREARNQFKTAQEQLDQVQDPQQKLEIYRRRQTFLQGQKTQLEQTLKTKQSENVLADTDVKRLGRLLNEHLMPDRELQEKEFVTALDGAINRAIDAHVEEQVQIQIKAMEQALPEAEKKVSDEKITTEKKAKEAKEAGDQAFIDSQLKTFYIKNKPPYRLPEAILRKLKVFEKIPFAEKIPGVKNLPGLNTRLHYRMYDRGQIESDFSDIVTGNIDTVLKKIYSLGPADSLTPDQEAQRGRVTKSILHWHKQATGKPPSAAEQMMIAEQPWMESYIKEQMTNNQSFQEAVRQVMGATEENMKDPLYAPKIKKQLMGGNSVLFLAMFGLSALPLIAEGDKQSERK